jgi:hypothetical protein
MLLNDSKLYTSNQVFGYCAYCNEAIYYCEPYIEINDEYIHEDCRYECSIGEKIGKELKVRIAGE